jgi:hypothetical protein
MIARPAGIRVAGDPKGKMGDFSGGFPDADRSVLLEDEVRASTRRISIGPAALHTEWRRANEARVAPSDNLS